MIKVRVCDVILVGNEHGDQKFKPWTRLFAVHIVLKPLGKVWLDYSPSSYG